MVYQAFSNYSWNFSILLLFLYNILSGIQEIEKFELSLTSNTIKKTIETFDLTVLAKNLYKPSSVYKYYCIPISDKRKEKPESN